MANPMKRTDLVSETMLVKVSKSERAAIEAAAAREMRTLSNWLRTAAIEAIERSGQQAA
jgi:uncharacterized protein (DUF1778 family)